METADALALYAYAKGAQRPQLQRSRDLRIDFKNALWICELARPREFFAAQTLRNPRVADFNRLPRPSTAAVTDLVSQYA